MEKAHTTQDMKLEQRCYKSNMLLLLLLLSLFLDICRKQVIRVFSTILSTLSFTHIFCRGDNILFAVNFNSMEYKTYWWWKKIYAVFRSMAFHNVLSKFFLVYVMIINFNIWRYQAGYHQSVYRWMRKQNKLGIFTFMFGLLKTRCYNIPFLETFQTLIFCYKIQL